jgi:beta-lactamase regulating signal transducer with metallopeptidase domain
MSSLSLSHRVLEALLNGGAQGMVLTVLVGLTLRCLPRINAATRHAVWFVCLLLVAALPVLQFAAGRPAPDVVASDTEGREPNDPLREGREEGGEWREFPSGLEVIAVPTSNPVIDAPSPGFELHAEVPEPSFTDARAGRIAQSLEAEEFTGAATPERRSRVSLRWAELRAAARNWIPERWSLGLPEGATTALVLGWLAVAVCRLGSLSGECFRLRKLKVNSIPAEPGARALFSRVAAEMGVTRRVELRSGPEDLVPMVAGFRHPVVLLPRGFLETNPGEQGIQVLRHELAHVNRRDDWTNLIQQAIRAVLFFHPAVRWIGGRLSLDREIACDDHVLNGACQARTYALLLTHFAGRHRSRDLIAAPAVWSRKTQLKERIAMILDSKRNASPQMAGKLAGLLALFAAVVTGIVLQASPRLVLESETPVVEVSAETSTEVFLIADADSSPPTATVIHPSKTVILAVDSTEDPTEPRQKPSALPTPAPAPAPEAPSLPPTPPIPARPTRDVTLHRSSGESGEGETRTVNGDDVGHSSSRSRGSSLEQRLDRLEELMEKLVAEGRGNSYFKPGSSDLRFEDENKVPSKLANKPGREAREYPDPNSLAKTREMAQRDAERAVRDMERTLAQTRSLQERAAKEQTESLNRPGVDGRQQLKVQRQALESARRSLERELEAVEKRLERLEEDQEKVEERVKKEAKEPKEKKRKQPTGEESGATSSADPLIKN